jgi:pyruvate/2-oxoglutarate dehydrogenase complex dihydrolipoamide acyltransferase (E2) component
MGNSKSTTQGSGYQVLPFSKFRQTVVDLMEAAQKKHIVHGIAQADVTMLRQRIAAHAAQTGEKISFTAFILYALGKSVGEHPEVHAYRKGKQLVIFDEVDISTIVEREITENPDGTRKKVPVNYVVRGANRKTVRVIHDEIREAQTMRLRGAKSGGASRTRAFFKLPKVIRKLFWAKLRRDPWLQKKLSGTVAVTAPGVFAGKAGGWAIPLTPMSLTLAIGGIEEKLRMIEGQVENREMLCFTMSIDHDIIDGGPAARWAVRFIEILESVEGWDA